MDEHAKYDVAMGRRLRERRNALHLTIAQVEQRTGGTMKASVLGAYERGERTLSVFKLACLASVYGMPPEHFMAPQAPAPVETMRADDRSRTVFPTEARGGYIRMFGRSKVATG